MFLDSNTTIRKNIDRLTALQSSEQPILIAVAYWGKDSEQMLSEHRKYNVICNLTDGGTNPHAIRRIMELENIEIHHLQRLHAKVVIGEKETIIGSANFSANGLGYGQAESCGLIEASITTKTDESITNWFINLWEASTQITEEDLRKAEGAWDQKIDSTYNAPLDKPDGELQASELFELEINPHNEIRMASSRLVRRYLETIEPDKLINEKASIKRSVWSPAQAANFLWVLSGKTIKTNIVNCRVFTSTDQISSRMDDLRTRENVLAFLEVLSTDKSFSKEIRYWATVGLEKLQRANQCR
ncbi:hypothetical protein EKG38_12990 [Shewanella canadensis]|uniref:Uncharacterized protein n=1 Tax=Shewanella canadensis TaxID=271096 RepID=A0A3S0INP7_9GAMM|nr:phospholipase D family protein [Shewanella canadensis]RTR38432.1 hypothetical protein EKG38_12990 [Shewanella canadensis]